MDKSSPKRRTVAISGSFRKHYIAICDAITSFEESGWKVLSPAKSQILDTTADFPILASDGSASIGEIEQTHLNAIACADALYVVDPGGYIGVSTATEVGWALAHGVPTFLQVPVSDPTLSSFCKVCIAPHLLETASSSAPPDPPRRIHRNSSLAVLQAYIARVVLQRGFGNETPRDILLLLVEEVGELAKALRKAGGLKTDVQDSRDATIAPELADVLIYILDLANALSLDLAEALIAKEEVNQTRSWA